MAPIVLTRFRFFSIASGEADAGRGCRLVAENVATFVTLSAAPRRARTTRVLTVVCATAVIGCAAPTQAIYSGTLQAPSAAVGSTLGGRVTAVLASEGDVVRASQVLVRFDALDTTAALHAATARLAQVRATLADLEAGARPEDLARALALAEQQLATYRQAASTQPYRAAVLRDQLRQAEAGRTDAAAAALQAASDTKRTLNLFTTGDLSAQERDVAVERTERTQAQVANAEAGVRAARAQLVDAQAVTLPSDAAAALAGFHAADQEYRLLAAGPRSDQVAEARAAVRAAQADVASARVRLDETVVRSPAAGWVAALDLRPGDLVPAGSSIATIDEAGNPYARIFVPQAKLGRVTVRAHVDVVSDALPGVRFEGVVEQVDAQAQFTPQSVQTAADRAVLTFGVKIRVHDPRHRLYGGTTVDVTVP